MKTQEQLFRHPLNRPARSRRRLQRLLTVVLLAGTVRAQLISSVLEPHSEAVESAIQRGLDYLVSQQRPDGAFPGERGEATGIVGLVGMSFLAAGHTPGPTPYGQTINRCVDYILSRQRADGYIFAPNTGDRGMYAHFIATLFLSELSGMLDPVRDAKVREALGKAVAVIIQSQNVRKRAPHFEGGWRYEPNSTDSDLSVSGWGVMAMRSARLNGVSIPDENVQRGVAFILRMQRKEDGGFTYNSSSQPGRDTLTALAILALELTGHHGTPEIARAEQFLMQNRRGIGRGRSGQFSAYYAMQASFQLGGDTWEQIGSQIYRILLPTQKEDGSWGPLYDTSMALLTLTVPYRQLPIYQRDETIDE